MCTAKVEEIPYERVFIKKGLIIYRREKFISWLKVKGNNST